MFRKAFILAVPAILVLVVSVSTADVRKPGTSAVTQSAAKAMPPVEMYSSLIGALVGGGLALLGSLLATTLTLRYQIKRSEAAEERRRQRILQGLYVEVFGRAARCARDADTWRN